MGGSVPNEGVVFSGGKCLSGDRKKENKDFSLRVTHWEAILSFMTQKEMKTNNLKVHEGEVI